jgi:CBS domain-containing protein
MKTVKNILDDKGSNTWHISKEATVFDALKVMADKDIGAVLVMDNDKPVGIFSERDYARKLILKGFFSKESVVEDFMTKNVVSVTPDTDIMECMILMTEKKIRHLPVIDDGQLSGVISIGDVVNAIIRSKESTINELESYIGGHYGASV